MTPYIRVIREAGGLGDLVRVVAVAQGLRKKYPEARIHFYGARYLQELIAPRATHAFDLYIPCPQGIRDREVPLDEIRFPHLNRGIIYQESHCCWCWAYKHEPSTGGLVCQDRIELWCQKASVEPSRPYLKLLPGDISWRDKYQKKYAGQKLLGIQVGATCRSREWPYEYWNRFINLAAEAGWRVLLFDVCYRWLKEIAPETHVNLELSINRPWPETLGKLAACNLIITPDSGFFHLAGCLALRTLGLFGCTSGVVISRPWNWEKPTHDYLEIPAEKIDYDTLPTEPRPCQPKCYMRWERGWDSKRYREKNNYCALMSALTPDMVVRRAEKILGEENG